MQVPVQAPAVPVDDLQGEFVMESTGPVGEIQPFRTTFFQNISQVRAKAVGRGQTPASKAGLGELRGYEIEDLYAIAEIGYHYLFNGGLRLAKVIYEGLTAIAPQDAYFALAMGLTHDLGGEREAAFHWYRKAAFLDPQEPRADLNQAELYLEVKDFRRARALLKSGAQKAHAAGEQALHKKAVALFEHIQRMR